MNHTNNASFTIREGRAGFRFFSSPSQAHFQLLILPQTKISMTSFSKYSPQTIRHFFFALSGTPTSWFRGPMTLTLTTHLFIYVNLYDSRLFIFISFPFPLNSDFPLFPAFPSLNISPAQFLDRFMCFLIPHQVQARLGDNKKFFSQDQVHHSLRHHNHQGLVMCTHSNFWMEAPFHEC